MRAKIPLTKRAQLTEILESATSIVWNNWPIGNDLYVTLPQAVKAGQMIYIDAGGKSVFVRMHPQQVVKDLQDESIDLRIKEDQDADVLAPGQPT